MELFERSNYFSVSGLINAGTALTLGLVVLSKSKKSERNVAFVLFCFSIGGWSLFYGFWHSVYSESAALFWSRALMFPALFIPSTFFHYTSCLTNQKEANRTLIYVGHFVAFGMAVGSLLFPRLLVPRVEPVAGFLWYPMAGPFYTANFLLCVAYLSKSLWDLRAAYVKSAGRYREQIKYNFLGMFMAFTGGVVNYLPSYHIPLKPYGNIASTFFVGSIAYAILRHRLLDIQVIVRKTLVYSLSTLFLTLIYVFVISIFAVQSSNYLAGKMILSAVLTAILVTIIFHPLIQKLQAFVDALFHRHRVDREGKLMEFSDQLVRESSPEKITQALMKVISHSVSPENAALYMRSHDGTKMDLLHGEGDVNYPAHYDLHNSWVLHFIRDNAIGIAMDHFTDIRSLPEALDLKAEIALPITSRGEYVGFLLLGPRKSGRLYSTDDVVLLKTFINQAAVAYERPKLMREVGGIFVHEIRLPLTNIALPAELTQMEIRDVSEGRKTADEILPKIMARMDYIITQVFLANRRVEAVQQVSNMDEIEFKILEIKPLIEKTLDALGSVISLSSVNISVDGAAKIYGSAKQIEIVFTNLIKNALEAMETTASKKLRIKIESDGAWVNTSFIDTGAGMSSDQIDCLFQAHATTKGQKGHGIGLYLSKQIVESHGGDLSVKSVLNEGTTFSIRWPSAAKGK